MIAGKGRRECDGATIAGVDHRTGLRREQGAQDHAAPGFFGVFAALGKSSANEGSDSAESLLCGLGGGGALRHQRMGLATFDVGFGARDQIDHAIVVLFGRISPDDDAVVAPDHGPGPGRRRLGLGDLPGELEARVHIGKKRNVFAQGGAKVLVAVDLIGQAENGIGVGMVDEASGQKGVHRSFDRRCRRVVREEMGA